MRYSLMQSRLGRRLLGGSFYLNWNWVTLPFWSDKEMKSCGGRTIEIQEFLKGKLVKHEQGDYKNPVQ